MKNTIKWYILILLFTFSVGCDDEFKEINSNPNAVTDIDDEYLFANAVLQSLRGNGNTYAQFPFASQYAHVYTGLSNKMFIDRYYDNFTSAEYRDLYEGIFYGPIRHIQDVIRMTKPGGDRENEVRHAMAQVVAAMNFSRLADAFGSVPYQQGGLGQEGNLYPEFDSVEFIYKDMMNKLKEVISVLQSADAKKGYPGADPFFNNDLDKWSRFANSLRLRLAMRIRLVTPDDANPVIVECLSLPLIEENEQNVRNENQDSDISEFQNPAYNQYGYWKWKMSDFFVETLKNMEDPRLEVFAAANANGEYLGLPNGLSDTELSKQNLELIAVPSDQLVGKASTIYYLTAAEVWLLRAEAALFGLVPGDANELYQTAIRKSLRQWQVSEEAISAYLSDNQYTTLVGSTERQFEQIATQLWIAVLPNAMEGWSTIRRTGYPVLPNRYAPKYDLGVTDGELPTRCKYPSSEVNINQENYQKAIAEQGPDEITTPLWWDVKN